MELSNKRIRTFNWKNPLKGTKGVRKEINSINGTIKKLYYCIVEIKEIECQEIFEEEWKD